jgi:hypothetical protein
MEQAVNDEKAHFAIGGVPDGACIAFSHVNANHDVTEVDYRVLVLQVFSETALLGQFGFGRMAVVFAENRLRPFVLRE